MLIQRADDGATVWNVEVADSWFARLRGLIGRSSLPSGQGLYFPGTNGIHMLFMRFAIDCVFVSSASPDGAREVVAVRHNMRPWTSVVWFVRRAKGAIELGAGSAAQAGINVGDRVLFVSA